MSSTKFTSFKKFYPYYLSEHKNKINKLLHVVGSLFALFFLPVIIFLREYRLIPLPLLFGYFFAWVGHFIFEKNKPATFKYPIYSLIGDWVMLKDILLGKIKL